MAKLMSKKTRETVKTITVLVVVVLLIVFYIIYPLVVIPDVVARADRERFEETEEEIVFTNDITFFEEKGFLPDTFFVVTSDNITLAALYFKPDTTLIDSVRGTVILLHADGFDRTSLEPFILPLLNSGLAVTLYDQRASGQSDGIYRYAGRYEGDNLVDVVIKLNFKEHLIHPIIAVGFETGADAVINAVQSEERIDYVIAVKPSLTSSRWIDRACEKAGMLRIPLATVVYHWWYQKITGFSYDRTGVDDILAPETKTTILTDREFLDGDEIARLREITEPEYLEIESAPEDPAELNQKVLRLIIDYADSVPDSLSETETDTE